MFYVYMHTRKTDNRPFYIGKGQRRRAWDSQNRNRYWKHVAAKHGFNVFILEHNLTEELALQREIAWISAIGMKNLTNLTLGGDGISGYRATPEARLKRSIVQTGRVHTAEAKAKIAQAHKGMKYGEETRAKLSKFRTGTTVSAATREKISKGSKGNQYSRIKQKYSFYHPVQGQFVADRHEFFQTIGEHPVKLIKGVKLHIKRWVCLGPVNLSPRSSL